VALPLSTATLIAGIVAAVGSTAVGVAAIIFAWRNMKATLSQQRQMAADERLWVEQRKVYQELAEWLAAHHLAGSDDPLYQPDVLSPYTSDPGQELEAKIRLFAIDSVATALSQLRGKAYFEIRVSQMFEAAMTSGGEFENHSFSKMMDWQHPNDAQRILDKARKEWDMVRQDLEIALRKVYQPSRNQSLSPRPWRGLMAPP
jgi:hypothetical protein